MYLSGYLIRRSQEIQTKSMGFVKPMLIMAFASGILRLGPSVVTAEMLVSTGLCLMLLGGVRLG